MSEPSLWHDAAGLCARAHEHQFRKDGRTPYAAHPARVALIIATVFGCTDEDVLAAAFLHDVIEDADVDYDDILERFGPDVADLCAAMTKDMRLVEEKREPAYDEQLAAAAWQARLIKLADVFDNLCDAMNDPSRRKLLGKADRALALTAGDPELGKARAQLTALADRVRGDLSAP